MEYLCCLAVQTTLVTLHSKGAETDWGTLGEQLYCLATQLKKASDRMKMKVSLLLDHEANCHLSNCNSPSNPFQDLCNVASIESYEYTRRKSWKTL